MVVVVVVVVVLVAVVLDAEGIYLPAVRQGDGHNRRCHRHRGIEGGCCHGGGGYGICHNVFLR